MLQGKDLINVQSFPEILAFRRNFIFAMVDFVSKSAMLEKFLLFMTDCTSLKTGRKRV